MEFPGKPQRIAVCIPSYRRPDGLYALLGALQQLRFDARTGEIVIVVVDNDAAGSARAACESARGWLRYPLRYASEPRKGIPFARNAAVAAASDADWIAFVDDDETPDPDWLATLVRVQRQTDADVVTGPVLPRFSEPAPGWIVAGGLFDQPRYPTGTPMQTAYTNNVLLRRSRLDELDVLFDERLTLGVGEDTDLFDRLAARGARIVWADEALVHETVPPERANTRWLVRRGYRVGTAITHLDRTRRPPAMALAYGLAHGAWWVACGLWATAQGLVRGRAQGVRGLQLVASGVGRFAGFAGVR
jgi:GT2 family glycosyltransferase